MTAADAVRPSYAAPHDGRASGALRRDVEGLRGVAVGLVLLYHLGLPGLSGGFAGVDVFFVISGFLITGLLLREIDRSGTVSLRRFYARRARRLLPAASLVLLTTAVAGWWLLPGSAHENLGRDVVASTVYLLNWELADRAVDYLAEGDLPSALQHYWSLSVEEQFYVVWPLLILCGLLLARRTRLRARPVLLASVLVLGGASFGWSVVSTAADPATAYFVSTTRVWELALGAALAFGGARLGSLTAGAAGLLAWTGAAAVLLSAVVFSAATPWPGWAAAVPTLGTVALLAAGSAGQPTAVGRALSWGPLVALGGISYATYLWHWPIIVVVEARYGDLGLLGAVAIGGASIVLAWLTGVLVERPLRFGPRLTVMPLRTLGLGMGATALTALAGVAVVASVPQPPEPGDRAAPGAAALVADPGAAPWTVIGDPEQTFTTSGPLVPDPAVAADDVSLRGRCQAGLGDREPELDCVYGDPEGSTVVAMLGDSKMAQWFPAVDRIAQREGWRLEPALKGACVFSRSGVLADCAAHTDAILDDYRENGAPDRALISEMIGSAFEDVEGFTDALAELADLGTEVVVVADNPSPPYEATHDCVDLHPDDYGACSYDRESRLAASGTPFLAAAAESLSLPLVDVNEWVCPTSVDRCPPVIAGTLVYRQGSHLTDTYVASLTPMLHRELARVGWTRQPVAAIRLPPG